MNYVSLGERPETPKITTFIGGSGSGKTTQMGMLIKLDGFGISTNTTTRTQRESDLPGEYNYVSDQEYQARRTQGRFLWDVVTGNGAHYSKDVVDIEFALKDPERAYVHSLIPKCALALVETYGPDVIKTIYMPGPSDDELVTRMIRRGDNEAGARERVANERAEGWAEQSLEIPGVYVVESIAKDDQYHEIWTHLSGNQ